MNRDILQRPFLATEIRQRQGGNGHMLDYVEGHSVIARLNDAFEGVWSFEVVDYGIDEDHDEVRVLGKLLAENVVKMQFGSSAITRTKGDSRAVAIADDLKAAATDALKKCATLFGVALSLYGGKHEVRNQPAPHPDPVSAPTPTTIAAPPGRLSSKQHSYLLTLSRGQGLTRREVDLMCQERFGVVLDHVTRAEASLLIEEFNNPETAALPKPQQPERHTAGGVH